MKKNSLVKKIDSSILDNINVGIFRTVPSAEGKFVEVSDALIKMMGYSSRNDFVRHVSPTDFYVNPRHNEPLITSLLRQGHVHNKDILLEKKDKTRLYARISATTVKDKKGKIKWFDGLVEDVTDFYRQQERFRQIFQFSPIAIWEEDFSSLARLMARLQKRKIRDIPGYIRRHPDLAIETFRKIKILDLNRAALELYGAKNKRELLFNFGKTFVQASPKIIIEEMAALAAGKTLFEAEMKSRTLDGEIYDVLLRVSVPEGYEKDFSRVIVTIQNISDRKRLERHLKQLALEDGLTKLLNIRAITDRLDQELIRSKRYDMALACLMIDVDRFKLVNDRFGHQKGNHVLKRVAAAVKDGVRRSDIVGRYGGDEFLVILPQTDAKNAAVVAYRIRKLVSFLKFNFPKAKGCKISVSIGVSSYPHEKIERSRDLIRLADEAMYTAKKEGRDQIKIMNR